jgi:hypothetical protein
VTSVLYILIWHSTERPGKKFFTAKIVFLPPSYTCFVTDRGPGKVLVGSVLFDVIYYHVKAGFAFFCKMLPNDHFGYHTKFYYIINPAFKSGRWLHLLLSQQYHMMQLTHVLAPVKDSRDGSQ